MIGQFINRFSESFAAYFSIFLTYSGYVAAIVAIYVGLQFWKSAARWCWRTVRLLKIGFTLPGPRALPILGNALTFACKHEDLFNRFVDACWGYDTTFRLWMGPVLMFITTNPRDYEIIFGSSKASHKPWIYRFMEPALGQSLLTTSGAPHKAHRKVITPMLNNKALEMFIECFDRHSRICVDLLEKKAGTGEFDILSDMNHCTFNMTLETVMGTSLNSESNDYTELLRSTEVMYRRTFERMMKPWLYIDQIFYRMKTNMTFSKAVNFIHTFVENVVVCKKKEHYASVLSTEDREKPRAILLEQLISHVEKANDMNDVEIRHEIYAIFTAAQDTSATLCAFACLMLAMHPDIQDKVRAEVMKEVGNGAVTEQNLPNLKYLEMVIRENVRLHPSAPTIARKLTGDLELENCTLPEGCNVVMIPFITHRNPKYWKDPEKFIPERFLPENSQGRLQYANASYSSGIRSCIGQKYSIMVMKTLLAHVVKRYRLSTSMKLESLRLTGDISIRSRDGYKVSLTKIE